MPTGGTSSESVGRTRRCAFAGAALAGAWLIAAAPAAANTYTPTRLGDPNPGPCHPNDCSLREAVRAANSHPGADAIVLGPGHYNLSIPGTGEQAAAQGDLDVTETLTVRKRQGQARPVIDANDVDRIFDVQSATTRLAVSRLVLRDGNAGVEAGGAIRNSISGGVGLRVASSELVSNVGNGGGAISSLNRVAALGSTFRANQAGGSPGGAISIPATGQTVDASDSRFTKNKAIGGGGIYNGGGVRAPRTTFTANEAGAGPGGGIDVGSSGYAVDVTKGSFTDNKAIGGGGVYNGGQVTARRSSFIGNDAGGGPGGGIDVGSSGYQVRASRSEFRSNDASGGGGIYNGGDVLAPRSLFRANDAHAGPGGGIDVGSSGHIVDATSSRFTTNRASGGGGIYNGGMVKADRASFRGNDAGAAPGGGIDVGSSGYPVLISNALVINNKASGGGGVYNGGPVTASRSTFRSNNAGGSPGGGIFVGSSGHSLVASSSRFTMNKAATGGAVYTPGATTMSNTTIEANRALVGDGGGIFTDDDLTMSRSTLSGNSATGDGGGISNSNGTVGLVNTTLSGNRAGANGGGLASAGAIASVSLNSVTVAANRANDDDAGGGSGGGLYRAGGGFGVKNSIVAGNTVGTGGAGPDCSGSFASGGQNLVRDITGCTGFPGAGDVTGHPAKLGPLADNGGKTKTRALLAGSPAIGLGGPDTPTRDQRGVIRGDPDSGAYERVRCRGTLVNRVGTSGADRLTGTGGADGFLAYGGSDRIRGRGGRDRACAGGGNDRVFGDAGSDVLLGQAGDDLLDGGLGNDTCIGGPGINTLRSC